MAGENVRIVGLSDFWRLLDDVEKRYAPAFEEVGPGAVMDLKKMIDSVKAFLELLSDPRVDFRVKLSEYSKIRKDVFEFCRCYAEWLGAPLAERLKAEVKEALEEAITWWGRQEIFDEMEG